MRDDAPTDDTGRAHDQHVARRCGCDGGTGGTGTDGGTFRGARGRRIRLQGEQQLRHAALGHRVARQTTTHVSIHT